MSEEFIIGLVWGVIGTLMLQVATLLILRLGRRRDLPAAPAVEPERSVAAARVEHQAAQIDRLGARLAVVERITTDPADRTARAIDALR